MSKGSNPRPLSVPIDKFQSNWDVIFSKKKTMNETLLELAENTREEFYKEHFKVLEEINGMKL